MHGVASFSTAFNFLLENKKTLHSVHYIILSGSYKEANYYTFPLCNVMCYVFLQLAIRRHSSFRKSSEIYKPDCSESNGVEVRESYWGSVVSPNPRLQSSHQEPEALSLSRAVLLFFADQEGIPVVRVSFLCGFCVEESYVYCCWSLSYISVYFG